MTEYSRPWNGSATLGDDGPYSDQDWHDLLRSLFGNDELAASTNAGNDRGIIKGALNELRVQEQTVVDATVRVRSGYANAHGAWYYNSADLTVTPDANAAGSTRYDVIVLRQDYAANTVRVALVKGTAGAGVPTWTQTAGTSWDIPIAVLELANGYVTITDDNIIDMRRWANAGQGDFVAVQNNSAVVLEGGDVVVWDGANDQSITTTTTPGVPIAGIIEGRIPVNGWGRIQRSGLAWVNLSDNVARGDRLSQGETARQAGNYGGTTFALVLAAGNADEQALVNLNLDDNPTWREGDFKFTSRSTDAGWLIADSSTIGDASSGADFADELYLSLFYELWASYADAELPILTSAGGASTRGASATADWAAHKRMTLPYLNGRVPAGLDNQGGSSANVITDASADSMGGTFGAEDHTLIQAELPSYDVPVDTSAAGGGTPAIAVLGSSLAVDTTVPNANFWAGADTAHNNVQPSFFGYWLIRV